jgi:PqqA peptide cyclase
MFPVLKADVSVREEPNGGLFQREDTYQLMSPFEAFLLLLFDGQRSVIDVSSMLLQLQGSPELSHIERDVWKFITANENILDVNVSPSQHVRRELDAFAFLCKDHLFTRPSRCSGPLGVTLYLTRRCNLNCTYCFADARYYKRNHFISTNAELDTDRIMHIVDQLHAIGVANVTLTGGEVALRPDLVEIVRTLIACQIDVHLATNACLIDEPLARRLYDAGLRRIQAKLDAAAPSTQDRLARKKGTHQKLIEGIKATTNAGISVSVASVMTPANVNEARAISAKCESLKVANLSFRIYEPGIWALNGRGGAYLNLSSEDISKLVDVVDEIRRDGRGYMNVEPVSRSQFATKREISVSSCPGMISTCTIMENGVVSVCELLADFSEEFTFGNVNDTRLVDIWNSEKANKWVGRNGALRNPCLSCAEMNRCKGGCPWKAMVAYGSWICDPQCVNAPPPTRLARSIIAAE